MPGSGHRRHGAPQLGRPAKTDRDAIAAAVLELGFTNCTVARVADALAVTPATVYRHTPTKAAMLGAAWDRVTRHAQWPPLTQQWRPLVETYAMTFWDLLSEHPGVVTALSGQLVPPETMERLTSLIAALETHGFDPHEAVLLVDTVMDVVVDHRLGVERLDGHTADGASTRKDMADSWDARPDDTPELLKARAAMHEAVLAPPRQWIERKLSLILDGGAHLRSHI